MVILAAETASLEEFVELKAAFGANPMLILAPALSDISEKSISTDAAAVALTLPGSVQTADELRYFADPLAKSPAIAGRGAACSACAGSIRCRNWPR